MIYLSVAWHMIIHHIPFWRLERRAMNAPRLHLNRGGSLETTRTTSPLPRRSDQTRRFDPLTPVRVR